MASYCQLWLLYYSTSTHSNSQYPVPYFNDKRAEFAFAYVVRVTWWWYGGVKLYSFGIQLTSLVLAMEMFEFLSSVRPLSIHSMLCVCGHTLTVGHSRETLRFHTSVRMTYVQGVTK